MDKQTEVKVGEFYHFGDSVIKIIEINPKEILGILIKDHCLQSKIIVDPNDLGLKVVDKTEKECFEAMVSQIGM
jgi:hypothetical protein